MLQVHVNAVDNVSLLCKGTIRPTGCESHLVLHSVARCAIIIASLGMIRSRVSSVQRVSDWLLGSNSIIIRPDTATAHATGVVAPALLQQLRQRQTVAPLSPLDRVRARVLDEQHVIDEQHTSGAEADHSITSAAHNPQDAASFPPARDAGTAGGARSTFQSQLASPSADAAAGSARQHWLDKHFPRARPWLQRKNIQYWLRGVQTRCK